MASVKNVDNLAEIEAADLTRLRSFLQKGKQSENNKVMVPYVLYTNFDFSFLQIRPVCLACLMMFSKYKYRESGYARFVPFLNGSSCAETGFCVFLPAYQSEALLLCHAETVTADVMRHGPSLEVRELSK
jgi:hypothetical protein